MVSGLALVRFRTCSSLSSTSLASSVEGKSRHIKDQTARDLLASPAILAKLVGIGLSNNGMWFAVMVRVSEFVMRIAWWWQVVLD